MDNNSKIFIYGTIGKNGLCKENADFSEDDILDSIYSVLEERGYEVEVTASYEENYSSINNNQKRKQRLIDANNIDWNGMSVNEAFVESMEIVLNHQKEIKINNFTDNSKIAPHRTGELLSCEPMFHNSNPCEGCSSFGSSSCRNECPYGE